MPIPLKPCCIRLLVVCLIALARQAHDTPALAADWHVATNGVPDGLGTKATPWDIGSALDGRHKVEPGDTLWIHQGRYKAEPKVGGTGFVVRLAGRDGAPVQVRAWKGQRVTIDGGLNIQPPATHVWIWDLEILVSESRPSAPVPPDPTYANVNRPWGGLNVNTGQELTRCELSWITRLMNLQRGTARFTEAAHLGLSRRPAPGRRPRLSVAS
jgi:hypothetical protein